MNTVIRTLSDALEERGYSTLTPVQKAVTKPELVGADLLVSAQTGSGKTLGFGLAIAPTLLRDAEVFDAAGLPLALVIAPTRELAMQVKRELGWLYAKAGAVVASCVGGMDMRDERRALERGAHIVVATPGRLRDHLMRGSIDLGEVRAVVLDEADEMLDLGFREDLEFILGEAPEERQTLLFSATVPKSIAALAQQYQKDAIRVDTKSEHTQHADIEYRALSVSERDTENAIINVLRFYEAPNAIVFCNTRATVNRLTTRLSNRGFSVVALSGELSQSERTHALQAMRDGRARVCVATDVAARGIDLPNLDLVVHAELPSGHETLLHRSGRTGRAGRKGVSTLIVPPKSRKKAERLLGWAKLKADWSEAPSADAVRARDEERMLADPAWHEEISESIESTVETLADRFTARQLAAAYLRLYQERHSVPEELSSYDDKPKPRPEFGPSVWFSLSTGRNQGAEPRRLLPMLCKAGQITKEDVGAIRLQPDVSYVEIRESSVPAFLDAIGPDLSVEPGVTLARLDEAPTVAKSPRSAPVSRKPAAELAAAADTASKKPRTAERAADPAPREEWPAPDTVPGERKPRHKKRHVGSPSDTAAGTPERKPNAGYGKRKSPDGKPKGPKPPVGKPNSKKNKARAMAVGKKGGKAGAHGSATPQHKKR
ncbi:DEAD/DEAH box helicase [Tropicimonas aquimaris]|uniref:DEAD/DEAH box helicase n=1 Tax=Tropicimonas aquimaris TaxID=914152 RepID=A0ABW3IWW3_9RHOB